MERERESSHTELHTGSHGFNITIKLRGNTNMLAPFTCCPHKSSSSVTDLALSVTEAKLHHWHRPLCTTSRLFLERNPLDVGQALHQLAAQMWVIDAGVF